jgi:hypothetical protein
MITPPNCVCECLAFILVLEITCFPQYMRAFTLLIYSPGNIKSNWKLKTKVGLLGVFLVSSEFALYYYYYPEKNRLNNRT